MKNPFLSLVRRKASSLVTTLLVLVVLSTIVVAFLQSMSVERLTARSLKNIEQAELASKAGYEAAIQQMLTVMGSTPSFVTGLTNFVTTGTNFTNTTSITLLGKVDLTNTNQLMPLVSMSMSNIASFSNSAWGAQLPAVFATLTNSSNSVDLNTTAHFIQNTNNTNSYRGAWINLVNSGTQTVARYAYIIMDEQARLNPVINNGSGTGLTNSTNWYTGPQDIQMTNALAQILTPTEATNAGALTNVMLTPSTLAQGFAARTNYENVKHLLTASTNFTYDFIPASLTTGLRAGKGKIDINLAVSNPSNYISGATDGADTIGKLIFSNLPSFETRDPSLRGITSDERKYVYRLAANIADYIDTDVTPSYVNGGEPAGRDMYPAVTAVIHRYKASTVSTTTMAIENQCFVQVWNPYTQAVVLTNVGFKLKNQMRLAFGDGIPSPFADYDQTISTNLTVRPNEYVVLKFPTVGPQTWTSPDPATNNAIIGHYGTSGPTASSADSADQTTWAYFQFYVNGNLVDQNRRPPTDAVKVGGLPSSTKAFPDTADHYQMDFVPSYAGAGPTWRAVSDPRGNYLTGYDWDDYSSDSQYHTNIMLNGRQGNGTNVAKTQDYTTLWVNRDYVPRNAPVGSLPTSTSQLPSDVAPVTYGAAETNAALAYFRNGPMQSIGELGNIFDPVQADDNLTAPSGGTPGSVFVAMGGRTLRVGQPEFTVAAAANNWNISGRRAIELIDLFTVNKTNTNSQGYPVAIGRVNPNTAPVEVLSAILAGIQITSDAGLTNVTLANIAGLATNIITNRPYSKLSDLYKLTQSFATSTNYSPSFANQIGGGTTNIAAFDRVREEAFGKIVQHFAIQSRTYRIIVIGQAIDVNTGRVKSTSAMESVVYFQPDAAGKFQPQLQYQRFLQ